MWFKNIHMSLLLWITGSSLSSKWMLVKDTLSIFCVLSQSALLLYSAKSTKRFCALKDVKDFVCK